MRGGGDITNQVTEATLEPTLSAAPAQESGGESSGADAANPVFTVQFIRAIRTGTEEVSIIPIAHTRPRLQQHACALCVALRALGTYDLRLQPRVPTVRGAAAHRAAAAHPSLTWQVLYLSGDCDSLGNSDPAKAVPMSRVNGCRWVATVSGVPAGAQVARRPLSPSPPPPSRSGSLKLGDEEGGGWGNAVS